MDPRVGVKSFADMRLPRASGDGPRKCSARSASRSAAPRERGWTPCCVVFPRPAIGCPARAGMDPAPHAHDADPRRLPRASGDGPHATICNDVSSTAAPRERGWTRHRRRCNYQRPGCPARAGMDPGRPFGSPVMSRLPRASGDGPADCAGRRPCQQAAPRERGWTLDADGTLVIQAGCPARAGMDPSFASACVSSSGLPRASGDGPCSR